MSLLIKVLLTIGFSTQVFAEAIVVDQQTRDSLIKNAQTWLSPSWIDESYQFANDFNISQGPRLTGSDRLVNQDEVFCQTTLEYQDMGSTGRSAKFFCDLMTVINGQPELLILADGETNKLKIKYHSSKKMNHEVFGEVLATRLFWALGFAADSIYTQEQIHCYGCSEDPFNDRVIDTSSMKQPRTFTTTIIERKFPGNEIILRLPGEASPDAASWKANPDGTYEGWSFVELLKKLPDDQNRKYQEYIYRDALRALSVFIHHLDVKPRNQRLVCQGEVDQSGRCTGPVVLMVQDLGSTFGVETNWQTLGYNKVDFKTFATRELWKDPANCQFKSSITRIDDPSMKNPYVSEIGRSFLIQLMDGFLAGEAGKQRLKDLFKAARVDRRGPESIEDWTNAFMDRYNKLKYPMGLDQPNFKCPR